MKAFLFVCFVAALGAVQCTVYSELEMRQYVSEHLQAQKMQDLYNSLEEVCPGTRRQFEHAVEEVKECANQIDEHSETACNIVRNHLRKCMQPMIDVFEECLPQEAQSIPSMVIEAIESGSEFLCKTDGEHVFELGNTCAMTYDYSLRRCERRVRTKLQQFTKEVPVKSELCDFYESFRPCFYNHIRNSCGHEVTQQTWIGFYEAIGAPCRGENVIPGDDSVDIELELLEKK